MIGKRTFFILSMAVLAACGKSDFFSASQAIEGRQWDAHRPVDFDVEVTDTTQYYDFFLDLRHNDQYPYHNIYFRFDIDFPNGKGTKDTLYYEIERDGRWLGKKSGSLIGYRLLVRPKTAFPVKGKYKIHIQHLMRDDRLNGIEDVGVTITPKD